MESPAVTRRERIASVLRAEWLYLLIVVAAAIALGVGYKKFIDLSHTIQHQRKVFAYISCTEVNKRHDETIERLNSIARKLEKGKPPAEKAQIAQSVRYNIELIDALAPKRNCLALANKAVDPPEVKQIR